MPTDRKLKSYARHLRHNQTRGEKALLLLRVLSYRAQRPVHGYIPDFYSPIFRVAIEVYGSVHNRGDVKRHDKTKRRALRARGIYTMYVSNAYALKAWPIVIAEAIATGIIWLACLLLYWVWIKCRV